MYSLACPSIVDKIFCLDKKIVDKRGIVHDVLATVELPPSLHERLVELADVLETLYERLLMDEPDE